MDDKHPININYVFFCDIIILVFERYNSGKNIFNFKTHKEYNFHFLPVFILKYVIWLL